MIQELEAELTELSEINSKTDNLAVTEGADIDEAIHNLLKNNEEQKHIKRQ